MYIKAFQFQHKPYHKTKTLLLSTVYPGLQLPRVPAGKEVRLQSSFLKFHFCKRYNWKLKNYFKCWCYFNIAFKYLYFLYFTLICCPILCWNLQVQEYKPVLSRLLYLFIFFFFFFCGLVLYKNMERFTNLRVILAQGPC